jgi:DNA-binding response OmpR family regulator
MQSESRDGVARDRPAILIVEDDVLLATAMEMSVEEAGYAVAGQVTTVDDALATVRRERIDAALLDVNLSGELVFPVAEELAQRGVPFVFVTAHPRSALPPSLRDRPFVEKPYTAGELSAALADAVGA